MVGLAVRCPGCGHALVTVDESPQRRLVSLAFGSRRAERPFDLDHVPARRLGRVQVVRLGRTVRLARWEVKRLADQRVSDSPAYC